MVLKALMKDVAGGFPFEKPYGAEEVPSARGRLKGFSRTYYFAMCVSHCNVTLVKGMWFLARNA